MVGHAHEFRDEDDGALRLRLGDGKAMRVASGEVTLRGSGA